MFSGTLEVRQEERAVDVEQQGQWFGGHDLDGDGTPDFVVGAPQRPFYWANTQKPGYIVAFSGRDAKPIFRVDGTQPGPTADAFLRNRLREIGLIRDEPR